MRVNLAVTGFLIAAILFAASAAIQLLRLKTVNASFVVLAILFLVLAIVMSVRNRKDDVPPVR